MGRDGRCDDGPGRADGDDIGNVALLGEERLVLDKGATVVYVFPRARSSGGAVDEEAVVSDPLLRAREIFVREKDNGKVNTLDSGFKELDCASVKAEVYHDVVCRKFLEVIKDSGIGAVSFESIDADETFLKLSMNRKGKVIRQLAERYMYKMPIKREAYQDMKDAECEGRPMKNRLEDEVPAYVEYSREYADEMMPFRQVDEIRIINRRIAEWINTPAMLKQSVVSRVFVAADYEKQQNLAKGWGHLSKMVCLPGRGDDQDLRDYFGEEITFFFQWFGFYVNGLVPLAVLGVVSAVQKFFLTRITSRRVLTYTFMVVVFFWCSVFNQFFRRRITRMRQLWGMKDYEVNVGNEHQGFEPTLEYTISLRLRRWVAKAVVAAYMGVIVMGVVLIQWWRSQRLQSGDRNGAAMGGVMVTAQIKILGFVWGQIAPTLADMENHRTKAQWQASLTTKLVLVKLFNALYPFLYCSFIQKFSDVTCDVDLKAVAKKVNTPLEYLRDPVWHAPKWLHYHNNKTCIFGCYPVHCVSQQPDGNFLDCQTNCYRELQSNLAIYFPSHVAITIVFILIELLITKWRVWSELRKPRREKAGEGEAEDHHRYTFLQLQAKCHDYEYLSWGGSLVEDFLELAIGFAVLIGFGLILPSIAVVAFVGHMIEYRLIAYRMTNITCRPFPTGAESLGPWQRIFEAISVFGVLSNVGLACFMEYPLRDSRWSTQLNMFLLMEHAMLFFQRLISWAIPEEPRDVMQISAFNQRFLQGHYQRRMLEVSADETYGTDDVDVGLHPKLRSAASRALQSLHLH